MANGKGNSGDAPTGGGFLDIVDGAFIIHELKDPLSVVETAVRLLTEKQDKYGPLTDRQERTLKRALKNVRKARALVGDLLEVGRSDAGCFQCRRFNPLEVVDDVLMAVVEATDNDFWETLQDCRSEAERTAALSRGGILLSGSIDAHSGRLYQDEPKFRQIVGNLIKNAFHHRRSRLEVGVDCRDDRLTIEVADDGPGVDRKDRELIFKRYTRIEACGILSRPGHGLGLAGARTLARHLGGDLTVRSNPGPGAVFCLILPMTFGQPEPH